MSVVIFSEFSTPFGYGVYNRHHELSSELLKQGMIVKIVVTSNHHFQYKAYHGKKNFIWHEFQGVETFIVKSLKYRSASSKWRIINWFIYLFFITLYQRKIVNKDDILIFSSPSPINFILGFYRKYFFGNKIIFEVRDIWPLTLVSLGGYSNNNPLIMLLGWIERKAFKYGDFIISTLPNADVRIKEVLGRKSDNFYCIPQGFNEEIFSNPEPLDETFKRKYLPEDKFIVCYAGTIGMSNALETIIETTKSMINHKDLVFLFVGEGAFKKRFIQETKGQKNVIFAPAIRKEQVQTLLKFVDVVYDSVHDSDLYRFGLSRNKWIDYLYAGKPLVFSGPSTVSIISEANCGFVVKPEDVDGLEKQFRSILEMEPQALMQMGQNGRKFIKAERSYEKLALDLKSNVLSRL